MNARIAIRLLNLAPLIFLAAVIVVFALLSPRFFSAQNAINILLQSAPLAVMAVGMSFVLLVGGIDLSIGSAMYVGGVLLTLRLPDVSAPVAIAACMALGCVFGALNGFFVVRCRLVPFIVTIAMLFIGRGLGLFLSNTQGVPASTQITDLARTSFGPVPAAIALATLAIGLAALLLYATPFGRYVYAIGADRAGARKAGIPVGWVEFALYVLCGLFAAIGSFISLFQVGFVASSFGDGYEFLAIAAAVLGGTSLFGGRGGAFGPVLGAVLIQTVQNGLVMTGTDPYVYSLVTAACIFAAVLIDSLRRRAVTRLERRRIMRA